jgi:hypothetical protein
MQKTVLSALLIASSALTNGAVPNVTASQTAPAITDSAVRECSTVEQESLVSALHLGKDSKDNPDACAPILEALLGKVVPKDKALDKAIVKAIERRTQTLAVTFRSAPGRVVDVFTLRAHKKDAGGVDFRYGSVSAADKAWSDWKTRYADAIDCNDNANRAVADTHLKVPAVGHMVCSGAFGQAVLQYNQRVIQKRPGIVEWSGAVINGAAIASVRVHQATWSVFDGAKEIFTTNVFRVRASGITDANRHGWETTYGKKVNAETAQSELAEAMGAAIVVPASVDSGSARK